MVSGSHDKGGGPRLQGSGFPLRQSPDFIHMVEPGSLPAPSQLKTWGATRGHQLLSAKLCHGEGQLGADLVRFSGLTQGSENACPLPAESSTWEDSGQAKTGTPIPAPNLGSSRLLGKKTVERVQGTTQTKQVLKDAWRLRV